NGRRPDGVGRGRNGDPAGVPLIATAGVEGRCRPSVAPRGRARPPGSADRPAAGDSRGRVAGGAAGAAARGRGLVLRRPRRAGTRRPRRGPQGPVCARDRDQGPDGAGPGLRGHARPGPGPRGPGAAGGDVPAPHRDRRRRLDERVLLAQAIDPDRDRGSGDRVGRFRPRPAGPGVAGRRRAGRPPPGAGRVEGRDGGAGTMSDQIPRRPRRIEPYSPGALRAHVKLCPIQSIGGRSMRQWFLGVAVVIAASRAAVPDEKAEAIVKKGIDSHGGADALSKNMASRFTLKGEVDVQGTDTEFTGDMAYVVPGRFKMNLNLEVMGMKISINQVINGEKAKRMVKVGDMVIKQEVEQDDLKMGAAGQAAQKLTPLLDPKVFTIRAADDEDVNGKKAAVVIATPKAIDKEIKLYFDKESGLLVKTGHK